MRPLARLKVRAIFMANARPAAEGRCGECGTRLFKIGTTPDHAGLPQPVAEVKAKVKVEAKAAKIKVKVEVKVDPKARGSKAAGKSFARAIHPGAKLVIVESPAKARTVGRFLGSGYEVRASRRTRARSWRSCRWT